MTATLTTSAIAATIQHVEVGAYRIATDAPESDGTIIMALASRLAERLAANRIDASRAAVAA